jgi:hypothetical protein
MKEDDSFIGTEIPTPKKIMRGGSLPRKDWYSLVLDKSETEGYFTFVGWIGDKHTAKSRINIECKVCGLPTTSKVSSYVNGNCLCKSCSRKGKNRVDSEIVIGNSYKTDTESTLTISEFLNQDRFGNNHYILECSVCSKDKELWPYGSINASVHALNSGTVPCGCSKSTRWTEDQYSTLIRRSCEEKDLKFLGFVGEFKGKYTKLKLLCNKCGREWDTSVTANLLNSNAGCRSCNFRNSSMLSDEDATNKILGTGKFKEGSIFKRDLSKVDGEGHSSIFEMYCPVCSEDEFVQAGVCDGKFTSSYNNLISGWVPCRCSKTHLWDTPTRTHQLSETCNNIGGNFLKWVDPKGYTSSKYSRFLWKCEKGHKRDSSVDTFLRKPVCGVCSQGSGNGYYEHRKEEKDYLYVIICDNNFLKIGRSFDLERRFNEFRNRNGVKEIQLLNTFTAKHLDVYKTEQSVHNYLEHMGNRLWNIDWTTESFTLDSYESSIQYLNNTFLQPVYTL